MFIDSFVNSFTPVSSIHLSLSLLTHSFIDLCQGLSAIHLAALNGQLDSLKILVDKFKIDVNLSSDKGWTPLLLSINCVSEKKALKCLSYLLESGADVRR